MTAKTRIEAAAAEHGWERQERWREQTDGDPSTYYVRGTRYVRVYYRHDGQVVEAASQTGRTGGRMITGRGKAERIIAELSR